MKGGMVNRALGLASAMLAGMWGGISAGAKGVGDFFASAYTAADRWLPSNIGKRSRMGSKRVPNPKNHGLRRRTAHRVRYRREAPSFDNPHTLVARAAHPGAPREQHINGESSPYPRKATAQALYARTVKGPTANKRARREAEQRSMRMARGLFFTRAVQP